MKLRDDLYTAKNSADLLSEMLAGISIQDPADVKQVCMCWQLQHATCPSHCCGLLAHVDHGHLRPAQGTHLQFVQLIGLLVDRNVQDHVGELAGQCEAMLPRLAALAEQITDEVPQLCHTQDTPMSGCTLPLA
jgi:hypothetical protein